jgi:RNA polymerase sigma-70 factor (ECF subfamily)
VLVSLVPLYREAIVLRFYEELSLEEIAQVTQAPLSTVKTRLYRGLAEARRRILANEKAKARKAQESIPVAS